jgi:hypothetical protein
LDHRDWHIIDDCDDYALDVLVNVPAHVSLFIPDKFYGIVTVDVVVIIRNFVAVG